MILNSRISLCNAAPDFYTGDCQQGDEAGESRLIPFIHSPYFIIISFHFLSF